MRFIEYWFKPYTCEYETNWATQCYNRAWYAVCIPINPLTVAIGGIAFGATNCRLGMAILLAVTVVGFAFNMVQLAVSTHVYADHCEDLYRNM